MFPLNNTVQYNNYGGPKAQISDKGPPFNSSMMSKFANEDDTEFNHSIHHQTLPKHL